MFTTILLLHTYFVPFTFLALPPTLDIVSVETVYGFLVVSCFAFPDMVISKDATPSHSAFNLHVYPYHFAEKV